MSQCTTPQSGLIAGCVTSTVAVPRQFVPLTVRLRCQDQQRRQPRSLHSADVTETGLAQPTADLSQREGVALVRVQQHVDREDQSRQRPFAVGVDQDLRDCDRASWREGFERLLEQQAAALLPLTMENVACNGDLVAAAKVRFE